MSVERMNHLKSVLEQQPGNSFARYALGMEYSSQGQPEAAIAEFNTLLEHDPNYVNAWFMGAQALQHASREKEAIEWLRKGIACAQQVGNRHAESEMTALLEELEG
jgi:Tfp pilus assembly protein PilF